MTQSPIEPPNNSDPQIEETQSGRSPSQPLSSEEKVALIVVFFAFGSILLWGLTRGTFDLSGDDTTPIITPVLVGDDSDATAEVSPNEVTNGETEVPDSAKTEQETANDSANSRRFAPWQEEVRERAAATSEDVTTASVSQANKRRLTANDSRTNSNSTSTPTTTPDVTTGSAAAPLVVSNVVPSEAARAEPEAALKFTDVPADYWARIYIDALSSRGLIAGYDDGTFKPNEPVTRAQVASIVSKTFDLTEDKETLEFTDIETDHWARESIGEAVKGGFMVGFPDNTFKPDIPVTRTQALTTLVTGLEVEPPANPETALDRYTDVAEIPKWATEKIATATVSRFVVNYPNAGELNPEASTTRAELAAMIYQSLVWEGILEPVETGYVVKDPNS